MMEVNFDKWTKVFKILLIEDNLDDQTLFKRHLNRSTDVRVNLTTVVRVQDAIDLIKEDSFDILFLDRMLPDAVNNEGFEIISELFPDLPIVMLTTVSDLQIETEMIKLGVEDYISKDRLDSTDLARVIRYSISRFELKRALRIQQMKLAEEINAGLRGRSLLLSSQMSPHFMFNALNAVQYQILNENTDEAIAFLGDFAKLMRMVLANSRSERISIVDELAFIELYVNLERKRYQDRFQFDLEVDKKIQANTVIPPMLLQPYIENAIIHGLGNLKDSSGKLIVKVYKDGSRIVCKIIDNGVGIEKSKGMKEFNTNAEGKSYGMEITNERFEVLNRLNWGEFKVSVSPSSISDSGTEVTISFQAN